MKHPFRIKKLSILNSVLLLLLGISFKDDFLVVGLRYTSPYIEDLDYTYSYKLNSDVKVPSTRQFKYRDSSNSNTYGGRNSSDYYSSAQSAPYPSYVNRINRDRSR